MAAFISVAANLRSSFLARLPARPTSSHSDSEQSIRRMDIHLFHHVAESDCSESQWLKHREIVSSTENVGAVLFPRTTELNRDKIFFSSFASATPFCGLLPTYSNHLFGFDIIEERPCHLLGGSLSRNDNGLSNFGILVNRSWAGHYRLLAKDI